MIDAQLAAPTSPAEKLLDHMVKKGLITNEEIVEALEPKKMTRVKKEAEVEAPKPTKQKMKRVKKEDLAKALAAQ